MSAKEVRRTSKMISRKELGWGGDRMVGGDINSVHLGFIFILFSFSNQEKKFREAGNRKYFKFSEMNCIFSICALSFSVFWVTDLFFYMIK